MNPLAFALASALALPRPVPLAEAIHLAATSNPDASAARAQAAVSAATVDRATSAWLPEVTATGTFDHTTAPQTLDYGLFVGLIGGVYGLTPKNPGVVPSPLTLQASNSLFGTVQVSQPLFSPQGLFGIRPAKRAADAAALTAADVREQVALGTARTYLGLQGVVELTAAANRALEVAKKREVDAEAEIAAGASTQIALLRAKTETARAEGQLAALTAARAAGEAMLAALVGEAVTVPERPGPPLRYPAHDASAALWRSTFAAKAARAQVEAAEGALKADRYAFLPTVAAVLRGTYTSNSGFYNTNTYGDAIVAVSVPLYDRGVRYAAAGESSARATAAREHLRAVEAQGEAALRAAVANVAAAAAELAAAERQAELARKAQSEVDALRASGLATNLELSDADAQRFLAESSAAQLRAALEVRRAELAAAEGRLVETAEAQR